MFRPHCLVLFATLVTCVAYESNCHAQNGVQCLQYPLFDFGDGQSLFDADYYSNEECNANGCGCTGGPDMEYTIQDTSEITPQACGACVQVYAAKANSTLTPVAANVGTQGIPTLRGTDRPLRSPLSTTKMAPFVDNLKPYNYVDRDGKVHVVTPKNGFKVLLTKWVYVTTGDGGLPIPVRLYAVQYDQRRAGIPAAVSAMRAPVRTTQIGFQFDTMPDDEISSAPTLTVKQIGSYKHAGYVTLDPEAGKFLVVTSVPLF